MINECHHSAAPRESKVTHKVVCLVRCQLQFRVYPFFRDKPHVLLVKRHKRKYFPNFLPFSNLSFAQFLKKRRMSDNQNIGSGVVFLLMAATQVSVCAWVFHRRSRQPIKARRAWLMLMPALAYSFRFIISLYPIQKEANSDEEFFQFEFAFSKSWSSKR
jgi:hypothetical protein